MTYFDRNIILKSDIAGWLSDDEIDHFAHLLHLQSNYEFRPTWQFQATEFFEPINPVRDHIQLLHSMSRNLAERNAYKMDGGHWICSWFDGQKIHIFDSSNAFKLHSQHERVLQLLFPAYSFQENPVIFHRVQQQTNSYDCGLFAIAFAVSLTFGDNPSNITYDIGQMRNHLLHMFDTNEISKFPVIDSATSLKASIMEQFRKNQLNEAKFGKRGGKMNTECKIKLKIRKIDSSIASSNVSLVRSVQNEKSESWNRSEAIDSKVIHAEQTVKTEMSAGSEETNNRKKTIDSLQGCKNHSNHSREPLFDVIINPVNASNRKNKLDDENIEDMNIEDANNVSSEKTTDKSSKCHENLNIQQPTKRVRYENSRIPRPLTHQQRNIILTGERLNDIHVNNFGQILVNNFPYYEQRNTLLLANPERLKPIPQTKKHIQLLFSGNEHWVCSYYDTKVISIYDSLFQGKLSPDHVKFLKNLYPFYRINQNSIKFPVVQKQQNDKDCGFFAIAFGVSLLYNERPELIEYDVSAFRQHLLNIFNTNEISPFPTIINRNRSLFLNLSLETSPIECSPADIILRHCKPTNRTSMCNDSILPNQESRKFEVQHQNSQKISSGRISNPKKRKQSKSSKKKKNTKIRNKTTKSKSIRQKDSLNTKSLTKETIPMKSSIEQCIQKLTDVIAATDGKEIPESRMESESIIKWCKYQREILNVQLYNTLKNLRHSADFHLSNAMHDGVKSMTSLCGNSKHTASTEPFFYETAYSFDNIRSVAIEMDRNGAASNILRLIKDKKNEKKWYCSEYCRINNDNSVVFSQYKEFLESLAIQKLRSFSEFLEQCFFKHRDDKLGHLSTCYLNQEPCKSHYFVLELLSPHFPKVRNMKRNLYRMRRLFENLRELDKALETSDLILLKKISCNTKQKGRTFYKVDTGVCLDEDEIRLQNKDAFIAFTKQSLLYPKYKCISCQKVLSRKVVTDIRRMRIPIVGPFWKDLNSFVKQSKELQSNFICDYCVQKFRSMNLPPTCVLNNVLVGNVPEEIKNLNSYEKILIQRAKVYQVVQKAGTVRKRKIPHTMRIQKLVGQTFHLPLPIEQTIDKICSTTDPINKNHELYILIRGIPTKSNTIWQQLVDIKKVFNALQWLQMNNPLYAEIKLPESAEGLLNWLNDSDVEYHVNSQKDMRSNSSSTESIDSDIDLKTDKENVKEKGNNPSDENIPLKLSGDMDSLNIEDRIENQDNVKLCRAVKQMEIQVPDDKNLKKRSMLTQAKYSDPKYEQYTIFPVNDKRINDTSSNLYQMLKIRDGPLNSRMRELDLLCFPDLYPYGRCGQYDERRENLTDFEYAKLRLTSVDPRFRLNQQYIFFLLNQANLRQFSSGIFHMLNTVNPKEKYTAKTYLDKLSKGELEGSLNTIFERIRNSEQYWRKPKNNLLCMARHYGPATWFLTLSPAEWMWSDLSAHIREINTPYLDKLSDGELIAADPVSASRFIENKFQAILDFILSESNPIGKVTHYFWRREYQGRGTQHFHMVIWVEKTPILGIDTNEKVMEFIMKYVTCKIPEKQVSPNLYRRVTTHQKHHHNSYCLRTIRDKSGKSCSRCRFGFPRPVTDNFELRDPAVSIAGRRKLRAKSRLYDLPRTEEEKNTNDYNPAILTAWEGNMDIQFIGESSTLLTNYCTKYATKYETSKTSNVMDDVNSTKSLHQRLWNIAFRSLQNREVGALEAADTLLGISLFGTDKDTTIKWLNVNILRNRKVKSHDEILKLGEDSTNIFCRSWIDDVYPSRPAELDSMCLYDFSKWYDVVYSEPKKTSVDYYTLKPGTFLKRRDREYLINHYRFNINVQPENYFYTLLLLFRPWRDVNELKSGYESYTEAFRVQKDDLIKAKEYHEYSENLQRGIDYLNRKIEEKIGENAASPNHNDSHSQKIPLGYDPKEGRMAMQELNDIEQAVSKTVNLDDMIAQMNPDQMRIFKKVTTAVASKNEILRLYVSGEGGTGKSFLIDVIRRWIREKLDAKTIVTAPTGIAAFNVNGLTVHRCFQLPVEHDGTPKYTQLSDNLLKIMREEFRNVELIIIDEISMISNVTLMYINQRLVEIFNTSDENDGWFGCKHILFFGDLLQLPPVREDFPYVKLSSTEVEKRFGTLSTINLWVDLFTYDELTINMRQQKDQTYGTLLSRMRVGAMVNEDLDTLTGRQIDLSHFTSGERITKLCEHISTLLADTVCLFSTREQCELLNAAMLEAIPSDEILLIAEDNVDCRDRHLKSRAMKILEKIEKDDRSSAGLSKIIVIKIGAKIMVRRNIDVTLGLVNGAIGTVESISKIIDKGVECIRSINIVLNSNVRYGIERMDAKFQVMDGAFITRTQFPISLSYGVTIHKSQGLSLKNAVIDAGNKVFTTGQTYVALSRVTTLAGVHLINFDPASIKANKTAIGEYNRLRGIYRVDLPQLEIPNKYWPKVWDIQWAFREFPIEDRNDESVKPDCDANICGWNNIDGASSYANTIMQCIIHYPYLGSVLMKGSTAHPDDLVGRILVQFLQEYRNRSNKLLDVQEIKKLVGGIYCDVKEQDPSLFFKALTYKLDMLKKIVEHEFRFTDRCYGCKYVIERIERKLVWNLSIKDSKQSSTELNHLITESLKPWSDSSSYCNNCGKITEGIRKLELVTVSEVVVIKFESCSSNKTSKRKTKKISIKAVPNAQVILCGKKYKVISAIFRGGEENDDTHYKSLLRFKKTDWIQVDDTVVKSTRWPRNSKNIYIIFLQVT